MSVLLTSEIQNALIDQPDNSTQIFASVEANAHLPDELSNFYDAISEDGVIVAHLVMAVGRYTPLDIKGKVVNVFANNFYPIPVKYNIHADTLAFDHDLGFKACPLESIVIHSHILSNDLGSKFDLFKGSNNKTLIVSNPFAVTPEPFTTHNLTNAIPVSDFNQNVSNAISHVEDILKAKLKAIAQHLKPNTQMIFDSGAEGKTLEQIFN